VPSGWIRIGEQHGISSSKAGKINVFGLLNYRGQLTSYTTHGRVDGAQIIDWLDNFVASMKQPTVVVLDNAPWHTSTAVTAKIEEWKSQGLELFFLPPYCPHLNIIETLWRKMKHEWLRPQDFNSRAELHERINHILDTYGEDLYTINFNIDEMLN
jgi:transposase